ncbi:solute-binding protein [Streptomyces purpureus]|uniref:Solute-binding protein n=2 Tax=Streptomyces purpureus TaxID=1951 RepID=A0A918LR94_9ACTN|nr:solute-binding protein [Streptomyces purpureus]
MQRRFLGMTATILALGLTATLSGCGAEAEDGDVTLKLVAADYDLNGGDTTKRYWAGLVSAYTATHPGVKIEVQVESWNDVDRKVAEMVKAGDAPDIAQIGAYADYAADGQLYTADELLSVPVQANFLRPLAAAGEQRNAQYGMPFAASTRLLFFNQDLFDKAGIDGGPKTWAELAEDAEKLKKKDVKYPFALPLGPEEAQAETMMWLLSGGDGYTDGLGRYTIDSEENVKTFEWLRKNLVEKGLTGPVAPGKLNRKDAFAAFARGEVGMLNGHPSLMQEAEKKGVKVGKVALPGVNGKARSAMGVADWIMGFKQKNHRKEIGEFLNFVFDDRNVLKFAGDNDLLPVTVSANTVMRQDPQHANLQAFLNELPSSELPPVGKTSWAKVSENIKQNIGKAVEPGQAASGVLGEIGREATAAENTE